MMIRNATCPICQRQSGPDDSHCPHCGCVIQFTPEPPVFSRRAIVEALVTPTIKLTHERIIRNPRQGLAHYLLGLCYLNFNFLDRGTAEFQHALALLPGNSAIRFELAMVQLAQGKHASALDQVRQARAIAPDNNTYRYLENYLAGRGAGLRGDLETALNDWIAAYEIGPQWSLAAEELRQFIMLHEAKLTGPLARYIRPANAQDALYLRLLNTDPRARRMDLPPAPSAPHAPGRLSMGVLNRLAPVLAGRIEAMHNERLTDYRVADQEREEQRQQAVQQLKHDIAEWRVQVREIRRDLAAMARLCLAALEAEERIGRGENGRRNGAGREKT